MTVPSILLIDDEPLVAELYKGAHVRPLSPADANFGSDLAKAIQEADLILLDHNLNLNQTLGLAASDGASLVGHLRSWARANDVPLPPIAIYTSADDAFSDETPVIGPAVPLDGSFVGRQARLAPALDVEWLISKVAEGAAENAIALAQDSLKLRQMAGDGRMSLMETVGYLGLPASPPWSEIALAGIARWRPPISEAGAARLSARGTTATLRWLLHQVLPCPGLLIPSQYAAWSLGIELDGFEAAKDGASDFSKMLQETRYVGPGHTLFPQRWWAAGIDFIGWQLRDRSYKLGGFQQALDEMAGTGLQPLAPSEQVVVLNSDLEEEGLAPIVEAVEIHPPGWPAEALRPWMRRDEVVNDAAARSMTDPADIMNFQ